MSIRPEIHFNIWKLIGMILVMFVVSMFFFPFFFSAFPAQNTKNMMAAVGIVFIFMTLVYKREFSLPRGVLVLLILSVIVSVVALSSITYNQTSDDSYVTYFRAAIIWLCASYVACFAIFWLHKRIDVQLVLNYLIAACLFQCAMALLIDFIPAVKSFVDNHFLQGQDVLTEIGRLYGIGAALDVAGSRFSTVLIGIAVLVDQKKNDFSMTTLLVYITSFIIISVIGNMIARTTLIGMGIGLGYLVFRQIQSVLHQSHDGGDRKILSMWVIAFGMLLPVAVFFYNTSEQFYDLIRFGFEGFFSLVETGKWDVASTNTLQTMVVFPEDFRTWIIGDGYFDNPNLDANYFGYDPAGGYYMGTDIGYLLFIFYFGMIGLVVFSSVIIYAAYLCADSFPEYKTMFWLVCLTNFIIWFKVATDLFLFFCLFICASIIRDTFQEEEEGTPEILEE